METSEGDPLPILFFLQTVGNGFTQNTINNTGLYLILGLVLCSSFTAIAAATIAMAIKNLPPAEDDNINKSQKYVRYFQGRLHALHSVSFLAHVIFSIGLLASSIYYFNILFPAFYGGGLAYILGGILTFYLLLFFVAQRLAANLENNANIFAATLYGFGKITSIVRKPLAKLLRFTDPTAETETENQHTTLRDILGQNSFAPNAAEEKKILKGILNFGNIYVKQIMRPRTDVVAHSVNTPFLQLCRYINDNRYSRVPIYDGNLDKIAGILYIKDLLPYLNQRNDFDWQTLLHEPYFVPETQKIDLLLQEFKRKRVHLAIVVDEYGGTSGIITLEDILEEIVGDIRDEFDEDEINYSKLDKDNFVFEGKTPLADVIRIMNLEAEIFDEIRGEAETLGGLLVEISGTIPQAGEKINYNHFCFTVENADGRRVRRVKISKQETATAEIQNT
ncbi:MAG: CBS domain-containing protein [Sphingobacteriales bacterium]|nr:MAG: CBS domain-containing protein [Sphingobacteriales bacterium]